MIKVTDVHGDTVLIQPYLVMAVSVFRGETKEFAHKPRSVIIFHTGGPLLITETVDAYWNMERLGLDKPL